MKKKKMNDPKLVPKQFLPDIECPKCLTGYKVKETKLKKFCFTCIFCGTTFWVILEQLLK